MIEKYLSQVDTNQKINIVKYASVFAGGVLVGYSIKKLLDSYDLDSIGNNAVAMAENYINPHIGSTDDVVDEENEE